MRAEVRSWLKFSVVSAAGVGVQAAALDLLLRLTPLHYLPASVLAVEAAVLHNFAWHKIWTWADRRGSTLSMLLRFHVTNGAFSLVGTVFVMRLLVGGQVLNPALANLASIAFCSLVSLFNFFLSDRFVFPGRKPGPA
jgi:putative flippase GtrA